MIRIGIPRDALLLGGALFLMVSAGNILTPLLPQVQREFGVDYTAAALVVSAYGFARLAIALPAGFLESRVGVRGLALIGFAFGLVGALIAAVGPSLESVVVGRVAMGLGASAVSVVVLTALSGMAAPDNRARVLSVFLLANNTAIGVFPLVGGVAGAMWGWRSTMLICAVLACLSAALMAFTLPRAARLRPSAAGDGGPSRLSRRSLVAIGLVYLGVVVYMINRHGFRNTALPLFAADRIGLDTVQIATGIALMAFVGTALAVPGAAVADRWGRRRVIVCGFVVLAIGDLAFFGATSYGPFLLAALVLGLGDFFGASQTATLTESVPAAWRGRALGMYRFSVDVGATIGPLLIAGILQVAGFETMVLSATTLLLLAAVGVLISARLAAHGEAR